MIYNGKSLILQGIVLTGDHPCTGCELKEEIQCFEMSGKHCHDVDGNYFIWVVENENDY